MSNHLKFCGCKSCRDGMHRTNQSTLVRRIVRRFRHLTKQAIAKGDEPPKVISVPYTD